MNTHNKKNITNRSIVLLLSFCLLIFALVPFSLSWFASPSTDHDFEGHAIMGYFERGSGTSTDPYIIKEAKHFYNFAWLQYLGKLGDNTYLMLDDSLKTTGLDMAGMLAGTEGRSGAIPPIGTTGSPFNGSFDGNGVVIKNLWVSTDPDDWYERPAAYSSSSVGTDVGLFGKISIGADIKNFYLENIEVTTTVGSAEKNATLGIVAGYVDGNISNIGVANAKLSFKDAKSGEAAKKVSSNYSLVGYTTDNVYWDGLPSGSTDGSGGGSGGGLVINPSADYKNANGSSVSLSSGKTPVPNSINDSAFFVSSLSFETTGVDPKIVLYTGSKNSTTPINIIFDGKTKEYRLTNNNSSQLADPKNSTFKDIFDQGNGIWAIFPENSKGTKVPPDFDAVTGNGTYPSNSIWFKPTVAGKCSVAFSRTNNGSDEQMSIYRYKRYVSDDPQINGLIDKNSLQEMVLTFAGKSESPGNKLIVCFDHIITPSDVLEGYEYVIGVSSEAEGASSGLVYLKLAGVNANEGYESLGNAPDGNPYRILRNIDFVEDTTVELNTMTIHKSILELSGTQSTAGAIYFNAQIINSVDYVIYHNASSITMKQVVTSTPQAMKLDTFSTDDFPTRKDALTTTDTGTAAVTDT